MNRYDWRSTTWSELSTTLANLEHDGWVIVSVCPIGVVEVRVIIREAVLEVD